MRPKSAWEAEQERGVATIDTEHQLQTRLVASLRDAVEAGRDRAVIAELLRRVEDTAKLHFLSEELLMRLDAYTLYDAHVAEHHRLLEQLADLGARFQSEPGFDLRGSIGWIEDWLRGHVQGMDRRFAESLKASPSRPG
jgi:hemerythrin